LEDIIIQLSALSSPKEVFHYLWDCAADLQVKLITLMWVLTSEKMQLMLEIGEKCLPSGKADPQILSRFQRFFL
jgi:hypothetical protein